MLIGILILLVAVPVIVVHRWNKNEHETTLRETMNAALIAKINGNLDEAISLYKQALAMSDKKSIRLLLIETYIKANKFGDALMEISKLDDLSPNEEKEMLQLRAECYEKMMSVDLALATYEVLVNKYGGDAKLLAKIGKMYKQKGDRVQALYYLQQAYMKDTENGELRNEFLRGTIIVPRLSLASTSPNSIYELPERKKWNGTTKFEQPKGRPLYSPGEIPIYADAK